ncbi:Exopolygalacturonase X-1 [Diplodia intermedia]|uniref:galacturonan 1,4-alpha-galacturonidase n=1 Tax=Diplodia intermedia TaxID=856260 RepID=A0ABR3U504_9PEZI
MLSGGAVALLFLNAAASLASPATHHHARLREAVSIGPQPAYRPMPDSPARNKTCVVPAAGDGSDDAPAILEAFQSCSPGGTVVMSANTTYSVGTALDLTFLEHVDWVIEGTIKFTDDTDYWQANAFNQTFQNATTFFQLGGEDVNVYGGGTVDGSGQAWYDLYAEDIYILRPILFGTIGLHGGSISNIKLRYSPQWYNLVVNSSDVVFSNIDIAGGSVSANPAKNTDGWDTYRSTNIVIQDSHINNGDDCVSFKPNSTEIVVQNLWCNGSHGISVGSLGQYAGEVDIVENVYVYNVSMSDASDGARIKVWPGAPASLSGDLQGGGGLGSVNNITYDTMRIANVDYAVEITQCYGQKNLTLCNEYPSNLTISNILVKNFEGTTSDKHDPLVGYLVCSSPAVCSNITLENIDVVSPSGTNLFTCDNIDEGSLGVNCSAPAS